MGNDWEEVLGSRRAMSESLDGVLRTLDTLLEPLKELNDAQLSAVMSLGLIMNVMFIAKRRANAVNADALQRFRTLVDEICPPLGTVAVSRDPCLDATISYVSALKECEDEGNKEEECPQAWGPAAQSIHHAMEELESARVRITESLGRLDPPRPIPWPIE